MTANKTIQNEITINANIEEVWDALTNSEKTKIYMYGCAALTDWKVGSELHWEGAYEGKKMIFVSGFVLDIQKPNTLKYSVIDPNATYPKTPENHLNVCYTLTSQAEGTTKLHVIQDGFDKAADGENRYQDVNPNGLGWAPILEQIKKICEGS